MLTESGRIIAIENDAVWVETMQRSTCASCSAQKGCGQSVMQKMGIKTGHLRIPLEHHMAKDFSLHQEVKIGIPNEIVLKASLFLYGFPLLLVLVFSGIAHTYWASEAITIAAALLALIISAVYIRVTTNRYRNDPRYQPFIADENTVQTVETIL